MHEPEQPKVRPLSDGDTGRRQIGSLAGVAAVALMLGIIAAAAYLTAAPRDAVPPPAGDDPVAPSTRLAVQGESMVWTIDVDTRLVASVDPTALDAVPWRTTIDDRRVGEVYFLAEGGDVDLDALPGTVFAVLLTGVDALGDTPLPVALVPIWSGPEPQGYDLVIARVGSEGDAWTDIRSLPGCGLPYPIAAPDARDVLSVWCTSIDDVRLLVEFPTGPARPPEPGTAADEWSYETLIIDSFGTIWRAILGSEAAVTRAGSIALEPGERVTGIAVLSHDGGVLYAGVARLPDPDHPAGLPSRLVAYDRRRNAELWSAATPLPFESVAVGSDGIVYAYASGGTGPGARDDSALLAVEPATGSVDIVMRPLDLGPGRLLALPG